MNVAIPTLEDRVSPVFDVALAVVVIELDGDRELHRQIVSLHARDIGRRVAELSQQDVSVLICGAISRPLEAMLQGAGILVISQICGQVDDVLQAFVADRLNEREFLMPGCCGRRRRNRCGARGRAGRGRRAAQEQAKPGT
jgi:predicted Fe-Mo cluster-binding NifX family protein